MGAVKNSLKLDDTDILGNEAKVFGRYLVGQIPRQDAVGLYIKALRHKPGTPSAADQKRLAFVRKHPWTLRFVDPGLALVQPSSEVRRRIYTMFSILEAVPHYHGYFLPKNRSRWYIFVIGYKGAWGLVKTAVGAVLVKAIA